MEHAGEPTRREQRHAFERGDGCAAINSTKEILEREPLNLPYRAANARKRPAARDREP
jgi:hypothetical protein